MTYDFTQEEKEGEGKNRKLELVGGSIRKVGSMLLVFVLLLFIVVSEHW